MSTETPQAETIPDDYVRQNFESGEPWSVTIARAIHDAVMAERGRDQWEPIATAPKDDTRIILMWEAFGGVSEHVELGKWSVRNGWVNTYGHAFTGAPTHWMPLPAARKAEG